MWFRDPSESESHRLGKKHSKRARGSAARRMELARGQAREAEWSARQSAKEYLDQLVFRILRQLKTAS
eukprot:4240770-Lingulodinium_polyedra.AAC.1